MPGDLGHADRLENLLPGAPSPLPRWPGRTGQYPALNNLSEFQSFNGIEFECCRP